MKNTPLDPETIARLERTQSEMPPAPRRNNDAKPVFDFAVMEKLAAEPVRHVAPASSPRKRPIPRLSIENGWGERVIEDKDGERTSPEWAAAFRRAAPVIEAGGIVILHGRRGNGKTTLAADIARSGKWPINGRPLRLDTRQQQTAAYRTAFRFFLDLRATYKASSEECERDVIDQLAQPGLLVLDELQERGESAWENRSLTHLIDARYAGLRSTILIANMPQRDLEATLGPSILDRVREGGARIEMTGPSLRGK